MSREILSPAELRERAIAAEKRLSYKQRLRATIYELCNALALAGQPVLAFRICTQNQIAPSWVAFRGALGRDLTEEEMQLEAGEELRKTGLADFEIDLNKGTKAAKASDGQRGKSNLPSGLAEDLQELETLVLAGNLTAVSLREEVKALKKDIKAIKKATMGDRDWVP